MVQEEIVPPRICDMGSIFAGKPSRVERSMLFRLLVLLLSQTIKIYLMKRRETVFSSY